MAAGLPENYKRQRTFQFTRDVPTNWEDSKVLNTKIGDYLTVARKYRESDDWYLGSITNEESCDFTVSLDFLMLGKQYKAYVYVGGKDTDVDLAASLSLSNYSYQILKKR